MKPRACTFSLLESTPLPRAVWWTEGTSWWWDSVRMDDAHDMTLCLDYGELPSAGQRTFSGSPARSVALEYTSGTELPRADAGCPRARAHAVLLSVTMPRWVRRRVQAELLLFMRTMKDQCYRRPAAPGLCTIGEDMILPPQHRRGPCQVLRACLSFALG